MEDVSQDIFIEDYMHLNPPYIAPDVSLQEALERMRAMDIRHLPVLHNSEVLGMLSYSDLQKYSSRLAPENIDDITDNLLRHLSVEQLMVKKIVPLHCRTTINEACILMQYLGVHALPVLKNGKLIGLITSNDLIQALLQSRSLTV
jgi:CBS domain-containing membrane protein